MPNQPSAAAATWRLPTVQDRREGRGVAYRGERTPSPAATGERVRCPRCGKPCWAWAAVDLRGVTGGVLDQWDELCGECFQHLTTVTEEVDEEEVHRQSGAPAAVLEAVRARHQARAEKRGRQEAEPEEVEHPLVARVKALEGELAALRKEMRAVSR